MDARELTVPEPREKDEHRAIILVAIVFALFAIAVGVAYYVAEH